MADFIGVGNFLAGRIIHADGDGAQVELEDVPGTHRVAGRRAPGPVEIMLRPEKLTLQSGGAGGTGNLCVGRVVNSVFVGTLTKCPGRASLRAQDQGRRARRPGGSDCHQRGSRAGVAPGGCARLPRRKAGVDHASAARQQFGQAVPQHCLPEIRSFLGPVRSVHYVTAARLDDPEAQFARARAALTSIEIEAHHFVLDRDAAGRLAEAEALLVGGGNTYALLARLHGAALVEALAQRVRAGMPYIGTSAGTDIAGPNILATNDWNVVGSSRFDGMGLVPSTINPHYRETDPAMAAGSETRDQRIGEYLSVNANPVLGIENDRRAGGGRPRAGGRAGTGEAVRPRRKSTLVRGGRAACARRCEQQRCEGAASCGLGPFEPATVAEATALAAQDAGRAAFIAGGTDLVIQMRRGLRRPDRVISLPAAVGAQ